MLDGRIFNGLDRALHSDLLKFFKRDAGGSCPERRDLVQVTLGTPFFPSCSKRWTLPRSRLRRLYKTTPALPLDEGSKQASVFPFLYFLKL